jgi:hypothetical protein
MVTITGSGFVPVAPAEVYFGLIPAAMPNVTSAATITAESPVGTGAVPVTVITAGGSSATSPADVFTYVFDGPQVTKIQPLVHRDQPSQLVIYFDNALEISPAQTISNYQIKGPGHHRIKIKSAIYNPASDAVMLLLARRLNPGTRYRVKVIGATSTGVMNLQGALLNGAMTGEPGSNYVKWFTSGETPGLTGTRRADTVLARFGSTTHKCGE